MPSFGQSVGQFAGMPSGSGAVNEFRNGWRYDGNNWQPPEGYTDAIGGGQTGGGGGGGGNSDPVATFRALQQAQMQANQPAISALQTQQSGLGQQYQDLLKSINTSFQGPMNSAIIGEQNLLGQRGLTNSSDPLYQQQMTQAQIPVSSAEAGVETSAKQNFIQDNNQLAQNIAALQTGANSGALTAATGITSSQNTLQGALAQAQAQQAQAQAQQQAAQAEQLKAQTAARYITPGQFDTQSNSLVGISNILNNYVYQNGQWYQKS